MPVKKPTKATVKPGASAPAAKRPAKSSPQPVKTTPVSRTVVKRAVKPAAVPPSPAPATSSAACPSKLPRPGSKQAQLLRLLDTGATMTQMSKLTGWQAHTIRATISVVFRKRLGLRIETCTAPGGTERIYQVTSAAA